MGLSCMPCASPPFTAVSCLIVVHGGVFMTWCDNPHCPSTAAQGMHWKVGGGVRFQGYQPMAQRQPYGHL